MTFGPFADEHCFRIEQSAAYFAMRNDGIRVVEAIVLWPSGTAESKLCLIEAKSSSPRQANDGESFEKYIEEVFDKFAHSYQLFAALLTRNLHNDNSELPAGLNSIDNLAT